jgi:hypothetical protein
VVHINVEANAAPAITPLEPVVVSRGDKLSVQVFADDPDGDNANLKYELQDAPVGMTITIEGKIEWTVAANAPGGTMEVMVVALDEQAPSPGSILSVTVNLPPALDAIGSQTVQAGQALAIKPSAIDANDADLVYTVTDLPAGAVFDSEAGFRWTPAENQVDTHEVIFVVTDSHGAKSSEAVTITVTEVPKEPALTLLSSVTVNGEYTAEPEATLDEGNKTFTVKTSGVMRFYRLRSTGEAKPKMPTIRVQDGNAVISYEIVED